MDKIDLKLFYELHWDCRQSYSALAHKLRLSKQVVGYRIKQLETDKVITSYHALIDWRKLGYNAIRVYLKWHHISPEQEEEIYQEMRKNPFFMWTVKFEGEMDIGFYLWVKTIPEFAEKWHLFLNKYRKYILKQEIYESVEMVHYPMKPLAEHYVTQEKIIGAGSPEEYDSLDYAILLLVAERARISLVELAAKVGITPKAVLYRLRKMQEKGIILGYNALIDTTLLGYQFYKVDFYLNNLSKIKEMHSFAKQFKAIVYRMGTIGGPDFEIEIMIKNALEMEEVIKTIRQNFPGIIESYRFHRFEYTIKQVYLPGNQ